MKWSKFLQFYEFWNIYKDHKDLTDNRFRMSLEDLYQGSTDYGSNQAPGSVDSPQDPDLE